MLVYITHGLNGGANSSTKRQTTWTLGHIGHVSETFSLVFIPHQASLPTSDIFYSGIAYTIANVLSDVSDTDDVSTYMG